MPYNPGTGIYTLPAIYLAVPGTTIIAAQHNQPLEDLEVANNYARPVVAGGTGGNTPATARLALGVLPMTVQTKTATGTWTKPAGCTRIIVEAVGGGGGSGGTTGALGNWAASGGGGSGFYGLTVPIDVSAVATGAVVIGAGGTAGAAGNNSGGDGGSTTITIGATTYTWPGGDGSPGNTANTSNNYFGFPGNFAALGTNVIGSSNQGDWGKSSLGNTFAYSGYGAPSPFGIGADKVVIQTTGGAVGTAAAANTGAGASGPVSGNQATNRAGAAGGSGFMRIWEIYD